MKTLIKESLVIDFVKNFMLSATIISLVLSLSKTNPIMGGFLLSLPVSTLIALAFSKIQGQRVENTFLLAKSIFISVPLTLTFFLPFLFADKLKLSFWTSYSIGIVFLAISYLAHKWLSLHFLK
jgi:hypothetical protein